MLLLMIAASGNENVVERGSIFTGETLTLLYVTDVLGSVAFYKALCFVW